MLRTLAVAATLSVLAPRQPPEAIAVFAAGCYWGSESVFEHVRGVRDVEAGFATPVADSSLPPGHRGYAEAARVHYDPSRITYRQLLAIFFRVAHDPTQVDRQGPDVGPQYRSVIFVSNDDQARAARAFLDSLRAARVFRASIATEIARLRGFRLSEGDQDFVRRNPTSAYVVQNDVPKLARLRQEYPALYRD